MIYFLLIADLINLLFDKEDKKRAATSAHRQCGFQEARKHSCTRASVCMWTEPRPARARTGGSRLTLPPINASCF
jgi:hypothetical protein